MGKPRITKETEFYLMDYKSDHPYVLTLEEICETFSMKYSEIYESLKNGCTPKTKCGLDLVPVYLDSLYQFYFKGKFIGEFEKKTEGYRFMGISQTTAHCWIKSKKLVIKG